MPFTIIRNDITKVSVDAIVNTANPKPVVGLGTDSMIHAAAGPELLAAREKIGSIPVGSAAITPAYALKAKYVIHTVGPAWDGGSYGEEALLSSCYESALQLALDHHCQSIAFPLISSGNYGFPKDQALKIAISAFSKFLLEQDMDIYLVVFDRTAFRLSEKLFRKVASYIDENYVSDCIASTYGADRQKGARTGNRRGEDRELYRSAMREEFYSLEPPMASKSMSLEELLRQADAGFTETLLKLIDESGRKDSEIYKKANLSKQHFSKIRNDLNYRPSKTTAIALALALELDLDRTRDLIGRAGYALTNSSKFDLIIRYFIEKRQYNIVEINMALYEFDQALLGA
jgi:O-acetyl-ADP-ribose deacetylase (regulator of RNase III)